MEVVQSCLEVFPRLYRLMHSATVPDLERSKKLQNKWWIKGGGGVKQVKYMEGKGVVKSIDGMGIRCQVEKTKGLIKICWMQ
jgi:hypothetical protein